MNNLFGIGILLEIRDKVSNKLRGVSQAMEDTETQAERVARSVNDMGDEMNRASNNMGGIGSSLDGLNSAFGNTSSHTRKMEREMQRLSHILGGEVPESTKQAYMEMFRLRSEVQRSKRAYGMYSAETMKAKDNLNQWALGLDDVAFKQIFMRSQLGLTEMQLKQQANSIKLNARMTKLMGTTAEDVTRNLETFSRHGIKMSEDAIKGLSKQTSILVQRMDGLQKMGVKPEMMIPPSTPGAFETLNTAVASSSSKLYGLTSIQRKFGASLEKTIKKFSAVKVAVAQANGSMVRYQLLLRQATAGMANLGILAPMMAMGLAVYYGSLGKLAFSSNEGLQKLAETVKGKVLKAMKPLLDLVGDIMEVVLNMVGAISDWIAKFNEAHPVIAKVASAIMLLLPALTLLALPIGFLPFGFQSIMVAINGLWTVLAPFVVGLVNASGIALAFASAIAVVTVGLTHLWKTSETFRNIVTNVMDTIKNACMSAIEGIKSFINEMVKAFQDGGIIGVIDRFQELFSGMVSNIMSNLPQMIDSGIQMLTAFVEGLSQSLPKVYEKGSEIISKLCEAIVNNINPLVNSALTIFQAWLDSLLVNIGNLLTVGMEIITQLTHGIVQALPLIIDSAVQIIETLVQMIVDNLPMLVEGAIMIVEGLVRGITEALPMLVDAVILLLEFFCQFLTDNLPIIVDSAVHIILALTEGIITNLPMLLDACIQIMIALVDGIIANLPMLTDAFIMVMTTIITTIVGQLPQILAMGVQLITSLVSGLFSALGSLIGAIVQIIGQVISTILGYIPQFLSSGAELITGLVGGFLQIVGEVIGAIDDIIGQALDKAGSFVDSFMSIGGDIISGLAKGISNGVSSVVSAITGVVKGAINAGKSLLGINSPSKVFKQIGAWTSEGLSIGIEKDEPKVNRSIETMTKGIVDTTHNMVSNVQAQFNIPKIVTNDLDFGVLKSNMEIDNLENLENLKVSIEISNLEDLKDIQQELVVLKSISNNPQETTDKDSTKTPPQVVKKEYNYNITVQGGTDDEDKDKKSARRIYEELKRLQELDDSFNWNPDPTVIF